jgi:hypothetical protein
MCEEDEVLFHQQFSLQYMNEFEDFRQLMTFLYDDDYVGSLQCFSFFTYS